MDNRKMVSEMESRHLKTNSIAKKFHVRQIFSSDGIETSRRGEIDVKMITFFC